ncbi:MAG: SEC-C domain-containing protein [Bacilli bacterium]|nr:SEC-C domain-containing protein [Bacilli bacterium]
MNTNSIININSIDNIGKATSCGSGKKFKQCCGK